MGETLRSMDRKTLLSLKAYTQWELADVVKLHKDQKEVEEREEAERAKRDEVVVKEIDEDEWETVSESDSCSGESVPSRKRVKLG